MEYSVNDLICILLKKWYVILIAMAVIGGISVFLSQRSFEAVQENYQEYTTKTIPAETETGTHIAVYQCSFELKNYECYRTRVEQKHRFLWEYVKAIGGSEDLHLPEETLYSMAEEAYGYANADFQALLGNTAEILPEVQDYADKAGYLDPPVLLADGTMDASKQAPLVVSNHLSVSVGDEGLLTLTTSGLPEEIGVAVIENYLIQVKTLGKEQYDMVITATEQSSEFIPSRSSNYTDDALLSQTVMKNPESAPTPLKAAATGAVYAFVFACFGVLLYTFIKDSRQQDAARTDSHA